MTDDIDDVFRQGQALQDEGALRTQWLFLRGLVLARKPLTAEQQKQLTTLDERFGRKS